MHQRVLVVGRAPEATFPIDHTDRFREKWDSHVRAAYTARLWPGVRTGEVRHRRRALLRTCGQWNRIDYLSVRTNAPQSPIGDRIPIWVYSVGADEDRVDDAAFSVDTRFPAKAVARDRDRDLAEVLPAGRRPRGPPAVPRVVDPDRVTHQQHPVRARDLPRSLSPARRERQELAGAIEYPDLLGTRVEHENVPLRSRHDAVDLGERRHLARIAADAEVLDELPLRLRERGRREEYERQERDRRRHHESHGLPQRIGWTPTV
jgi:hypothetical protein